MARIIATLGVQSKAEMLECSSMQEFRLYVDENGVSDLNHWDQNFTLCGIVVQKFDAEAIKIKADQIKFKYWNNTDVVFHSHEISNKSGDFSILKNPVTEKDFTRDLLMLLSSTGFRCMIVSIDKTRASAEGWNSGKILDEANDHMIQMFLRFLAKRKRSSRGQIILESSSAQDIAFYKRYAQYIAHGFAGIMTSDEVKRSLTSLSFVSKTNHDIEAQLADLLAYPATQKFLNIEGKKAIVPGTYLEKMCSLLESKLVDLGPGTSTKARIRLPVLLTPPAPGTSTSPSQATP